MALTKDTDGLGTLNTLCLFDAPRSLFDSEKYDGLKPFTASTMVTSLEVPRCGPNLRISFHAVHLKKTNARIGLASLRSFV